MAYRVKINGMLIECDTAEEAVGLSAMNSPSLPLYDHQSKSRESPPGLEVRPMSKREPRVSNSVKVFLSALQEAYPAPLTSEALAEVLSTTSKGLPAIVVGIRVLFGKWGVKFEDAIEYTKRSDGETTVREYRLTTNGLRVLQEQTK